MGCTQSANATSDDAKVEARAAAAKIYEGRIAELEGRIEQLSLSGNAHMSSTPECTLVRAASRDIRRPDDNKLWADKTDMGIIDRTQGYGLLTIKVGSFMPGRELIVDKAEYTAAEVADANLNGFYTIVLSTVKAGAWRASWAMNFCAHLNALVPMCQTIALFAVKGGPACDCEIAFIGELMKVLGAAIVEEKKDYGSFWESMYSLSRSVNGSPINECRIILYQCKTIDEVNPEEIAVTFAAEKNTANAPNLFRCIVASAPVKGLNGEPIAETLNAKVGEGLALAKRNAANVEWGK